MSEIILNTSSCYETKPVVNQFTSGFDSIKFIIDENVEGMTLGIITSINGNVRLVTENDEELTLGIDSETQKCCLTWTPANQITAESGIVRYQIIAMKLDENGEYSSMWHSNEGRIVVNESLDAREYVQNEAAAAPSMLLQLLTKINHLQEKTASMQNGEFDSGLKLNCGNVYETLPEASEQYRGVIITVYNKQEGDNIYICLCNGTDKEGNYKYEWHPVVNITPLCLAVVGQAIAGVAVVGTSNRN